MASLRARSPVRAGRFFAFAFVAFFSLSAVLYHNAALKRIVSAPFQRSETASRTAQEPLTTVIASQKKDNATWLQEVFPDWIHNIYITDDPDATLTVPVEKGREGMVYLTYIIDNYETLPPVMIFKHANRYQWHADNPLYDEERVLSRLQVPWVQTEGYVNLRCVWTLGCPVEIHPITEATDDPDLFDDGKVRGGAFYKAAFEHLFPGVEVPSEVGVACCAEFAVADWKIWERPKSDYEHYRQWLLDTPLSDHASGIILEYSWHIMFGKPAVFCPNAAECYCNVFGVCDLDCETEGTCKSQYTLPPSSELPEGWPWYDWDGNWQNATLM